MIAQWSILTGFPATLAVAALTLAPTHAGAESLAVTKRVEYVPVQSMTHDIGSKSMRGYYVQRNGACSVILMIAEKIDPERSAPLSAARVRLVLQPGAVAGLDNEAGRSLNFTCGPAAARLLVDEGETSALIAQQGLAAAD